MEENKNRWRSRIEIIQTPGISALQEVVNEFCKHRFVVGIQYPDSWQSPENLVAVISYKVKEED